MDCDLADTAEVDEAGREVADAVFCEGVRRPSSALVCSSDDFGDNCS